MSDLEDNIDAEPPVVDPYEVLGVERTATPDQIKSAYRKAALKNHPDKVPESQKATAHTTFQSIALSYAVLSSPTRRARYDATGSTAESIADSDGFNWTDFYRAQYAQAVSGESIARFAASYKGGNEERHDLLAAYKAHQGRMGRVYQTVMLSSVVDDDERFRGIIDAAIAAGEVEAHAAYTNEGKKKRTARVKAARAEAAEAEEYAKEIGVHDKLFGDEKGDGKAVKGKGKGKGKGKAKGKENSEDALAALILGRQKERGEDYFDHLAEKYASGSKKSKTKRVVEKEPDEEAFQAAAARLGKRKSAEDPAPKVTKKSRR